jgi:tRNA(fMet)-specific endonuclease VapC
MALRIALDANRYTDLVKGDLEIIRVAQEADEVYLPFPVLGELRAGFALGHQRRENEQVLQRFLSKPGVDVLYATDSTTLNYASLFRQLRHQGTPIPANDIWIAALVLENALLLCTRDRHFEHLPQIGTL